MLLTSIIAFLVIFSILILVHEWGHFISARIFGVKVEEFGLGLPPKAKRFFTDKKKTEYTLNWLPLGGFVRMKGEDSYSPQLVKAKDSFIHQKIWKRIIIVCAGVIMNLVTGFILLIFVFNIGQTLLSPLNEVNEVKTENPHAEFVSEKNVGMLVSEVLENSPAAQSELKRFDFIEKVNGENFTDEEEFLNLLKNNSEQEVVLSVLRRDYAFETRVVVGADGKIGSVISGPFAALKLRYSFPRSVLEAGRETYRLTGLITQAVGNLFGSLLHGQIPRDIGGPVAIAKETFYRASSLLALLNFAAMLSITLAIFNILPIPALDGGRLLFLLFELITHKKPSPKLEAQIHAAGYVLLLSLIVLISWKDIFR